MNKYFVSISIIVVSLLIGLGSYPNLTTEVPIHWSNGEVSNFVPKAAAILFIPLFMVMNVFMISLATVRAKTDQNEALLWRVNNGVLLVLFILHLLIISWGLEIQYSMPHFIGIVLGGMLIYLGFNMQKTKPNLFYGLRTPWTLKDEEVWKWSNQFAGKLLIVNALIIIGLSFVVTDYITQLIMYLLLLTVLISVFMSYWYYKKLNP